MLYMNSVTVHRNRTICFQIPYPSSSTGIFPQDLPEDVSTDEDDDEFSRGRRKKKAVKPWEKDTLEKVKGKARSTFGRGQSAVTCVTWQSIRYKLFWRRQTCCLGCADLYHVAMKVKCEIKVSESGGNFVTNFEASITTRISVKSRTGSSCLHCSIEQFHSLQENRNMSIFLK